MKKLRSADHVITPMAVRHSAVDQVEEIIEILAKPSGFSKLTSDQRKFLMGVALAAVVPADMRIMQSEVEKLQKIMKAKIQCPAHLAQDIVSLACSKPQPPHITEMLAKALPELLGSNDLIGLIGQLWEIAIADSELHPNEERLVYHVADLAGVPRKRVAEQLALASARS